MYQDLIREVVPDTDAPPAAIEALMRVQTGGTLDHLDRAQFAEQALLAAEVWSLLGEDDRRFYAETSL